MANQITIDIGAVANDGTGDPLRTAFNYVNNNFSNVWNTGLPNSNVQFLDNRILTVNSNANLVLAPNGIAKVVSNVSILPNMSNVHSMGSSDRRWNTLYAQYLDISNDITFGDLTVDGNLTVTGNIIEIGNIVTDAKTIQLANTAGTANAANGSGITVGASDNIATLLYNSTSNTWTTNIGVSVTGNVSGNYILGNGALLTGMAATYGNANVAAYLPTYTGNLSAGNASVTNVVAAQNISATNGTFTGDQFSDGAMYVGTPAGTVLGSDVVIQITANSGSYSQTNFQNINSGVRASSDYILTANNGNNTSRYLDLGITSSGWDGSETNVLAGLAANNGYLYVQDGNLTVGTRNGNVSYGWNFDTTGNLTVPKDIIPTANNTQNLGSATRQWNDLYLSNATIFMNNVPISLTAGNVLTVNGADVVTTAANGESSIGNLDILGTTISIASGAPETYINLSATVEGWAYIQVPKDATANVYNTRIHNDAGNIEFGTGDYSTGSTNYTWTLDNTGNVNLPANGDINFNGGSIAQTLNEDIYIRASDDESDGWSIYNVVDDGAGNILSQTRLEFDQYTIRTDAQGASYTWAFRDTGVLELPGDIYGNVGGNLTIKIGDQAGSNTFIDLQTRSYTGDALISNIRIANPDVTISTASAAYNWTFDNAGNLTVPGNIQSISTGFAFSSGIIGIDNTSPAVITVADSVFPDVVTGRVTISEVNPPVQANGTWYYESVETNQFALYLDAELTQPVDATGWPGYVDNGLAVSPGYSNVAITGGNVSIVTNTGETWTFEAGGALRIPNDIVSSGTIDLDNRATSNTADIRLFAADDIQLQGRDRPDDLESEGGDINIYAGIGAAAVTGGVDTGGGGDVQIRGGTGGAGEVTGAGGSAGGFVTIQGGEGGNSLDSTVGGGGDININAGSAPVAANTALGGLGGGVNIRAGDTTRINESGGSITLFTGEALGNGTGTAGYVEINIASSNVGPGGSWTFGGTGTTLNVPANAEIYGANFGNFTVGCAGNTIVTSSDYGANVKNWVFGYTGTTTFPDNTLATNDDFVIQVTSRVPSGVTGITSSSGFWESNPVSDLATTGGTGTGLRVNVTQEGGYASVIAIATAGTGYTNGDTITVTSGSSSAIFTISVPTPNWTLGTDSSLTLPAISLGTDLDEQTVISSQRKLIPPFRWSAVIDAGNPTIVYTATDVNTTSMKVTMQIQHSGLGMEFFEVFATFTGSDTFYTVNNRVSPTTIEPSTVIVGLTGTPAMKITVTINSGAGTSWVTYDAVEFGIPND